MPGFLIHLCLFCPSSERVTLQHSSTTSTSNSITVNWHPIPCEIRWPGSITYQSNLTGNGVLQVTDRSTTDESVSFDNLKPCSSYTVKTRAVSDKEYSSKLLTQVTTKPVGRSLLPSTAFIWLEPNATEKYCDKLFASYL